jgi:hypothetical protein
VKRSAKAIYKVFIAYLDEDVFVGADMARKCLQMGTHSRRYAKYKGARKYDKTNAENAESAAIFCEHWKEFEADDRCASRKKDWKSRCG